MTVQFEYILNTITGEKGLRIDIPGTTGLRGDQGLPGDLGTNLNFLFIIYSLLLF